MKYKKAAIADTGEKKGYKGYLPSKREESWRHKNTLTKPGHSEADSKFSPVYKSIKRREFHLPREAEEIPYYSELLAPRETPLHSLQSGTAEPGELRQTQQGAYHNYSASKLNRDLSYPLKHQRGQGSRKQHTEFGDLPQGSSATQRKRNFLTNEANLPYFYSTLEVGNADSSGPELMEYEDSGTLEDTELMECSLTTKEPEYSLR